MKIVLELSSFDRAEDYEALEKKAEDSAFDFSVNMKVQHQPSKARSIWELQGDEKDIEAFKDYLNI